MFAHPLIRIARNGKISLVISSAMIQAWRKMKTFHAYETVGSPFCFNYSPSKQIANGIRRSSDQTENTSRRIFSASRASALAETAERKHAMWLVPRARDLF